MPSTDMAPLGSIASPRTFHCINLGCKVNRVETDTIAAALLAAGAKRGRLENASLVIINTCSVTGEAEKKSRKAIRQALKRNPEAAIIVTGCSAALAPLEMAELGANITVIQRGELLASIEDAFNDEHPLLRTGTGFPTRVNLKVQDGCDRACTYCIVCQARGRATSTDPKTVLSQVERYTSTGTKELVLTGIDLGSYASQGMKLHDLLEGILATIHRNTPEGERQARVRASSLEPMSLDERFVELLAESDGRICRHLHLPLQSGSSRVLREMGRPYDADGYLDLISSLRAAMPTISITTDIICGFPGETDADHRATLDLARECRFSKIHAFPYSRREGTVAAARTDQISPEVKRARTDEMIALGDRLREVDRASRCGEQELVLIEPDHGITESYHEIQVDPSFPVGTLTPITLP